MNIRSTSQRMSPQQVRRQQARNAYAEAKKEFEAAAEPHYDKVVSASNWDGGLSIGAGVLAGGSVVALSAIKGFALSHGAEIAAPALLVGGAVHFATKYFMNRSIEGSTLPKFEKAEQKMVEARESYRDTLIAELNDEGVETLTTPRWNELKSWEANVPSLRTRDTVPTERLDTELSRLENLADGRQSEGWTGRLANLEDDPHEFFKQQSFVAENKNLEQVLQQS